MMMMMIIIEVYTFNNFSFLGVNMFCSVGIV